SAGEFRLPAHRVRGRRRGCAGTVPPVRPAVPACTPAATSSWKADPYFLARLTYSPLRVSTRSTSPISTKSGTLTTAPELSLAGLVPPVAVSPRRPGSVSTTSSSTKLGGVTEIG